MGFGGFVLTAYLRRDRETLFNRVLSSQVITAFGKYSYALYLFNLPLRALVRDTVLTPESFSSFPGGALVGQLAFYVVAGCLAFGMAFLSYQPLREALPADQAAVPAQQASHRGRLTPAAPPAPRRRGA